MYNRDRSRMVNAVTRDSAWRPTIDRPPRPSSGNNAMRYDDDMHKDHYWREPNRSSKIRRRSRSPDPRSNARVGISLITRSSLDDGSQGLVVESQTHSHPVDSRALQTWILEDHLQHPRRNDEAALIVVEGYSEGLDVALRSIVPRYPRYIGNLVRDRKLRHPFVPAESGYGQCDVAFVMCHYGGSGYARKEADSAHAGSETWVGAWMGSVRLVHSHSQDAEYRPVIILTFPMVTNAPNYYADLLRVQYQNHGHLFMRLRLQPLFIFMDLYRMFTKWDLVTREINNACVDAEEECFDRVSRVIPRVAALHRNLADLSLIRQHMHMHELARRRFASLIGTIPDPRNSRIEMADVALQKQRLLDRLTDVEDELSTNTLVLDMLKERFQNLVDLEFNVASAKTDVRVAALSILAFAIAPVGFVASIFGITTMTAPVKWFAVAGSIVAVLSLVIWLSVNEYYSRVESDRGGARPLVKTPRELGGRRKKKRPGRPGDAEKGYAQKGFVEHDTVHVMRIDDRLRGSDRMI